jgi:hypothetical protein
MDFQPSNTLGSRGFLDATASGREFMNAEAKATIKKGMLRRIYLYSPSDS